MNNPYNLPMSEVEKIEALTPEEMQAVRRNLRMREESDAEVRETVQQYVADGGDVSHLTE